MPTFTTRAFAPVDFVFIFVRLLVLSPKPERSLRRMDDDQVGKIGRDEVVERNNLQRGTAEVVRNRFWQFTIDRPVCSLSGR